MTTPIRCRYYGHSLSRKGDADTLPILTEVFFTKFVHYVKGKGQKESSNTDAMPMTESLGIAIPEYRETLTFETSSDTVSVGSIYLILQMANL